MSTPDAPTGDEPTEVLNTEPPAAASAPAPAAVPPAAAVAPTRSSALRWLTPTLALLAVAVIALFGGILIGQHTAGPGQAAGFNRPGGQFQNGPGQPGQQGQRGNGAPQGGTGQQGNATRPGVFGGLTAGTIQSIDGDTITVKLRDGSTVTVKTTDSTTVTKTEKSSVSDLTSGETVIVRGAKDGSGNVSATSITEGANAAFGARPGANG
ncbi:DUF5666 domain-containing protein [Lacisediminihabitans sp. FW035]